ncbi:unnamed protein product, partial [Mesorhabditis spiculigera]
MFVLGLAGNMSVIYCTLRNQRLQSVQNLFILNLSVADLAICVFSLPLTPITNILKNWLFGAEMCHGLPWIQGVTIFIATFSLTAIAIDRYYMILKPHTPVRKYFVKPVMFVIWILSAIFTLPYAMYMQAEDYCGYFCTEAWPNPELQKIYTVFVLFTQYIVPFSVIFFCYYRIFVQLRMRTQEKIRKYNERSLVLFASAGIMSAVGHSIHGKDILAQISKKSFLIARARKNTILLVSMVFVFGFCWLPQHIVAMIIDTQAWEEASQSCSKLKLQFIDGHEADMRNNTEFLGRIDDAKKAAKNKVILVVRGADALVKSNESLLYALLDLSRSGRNFFIVLVVCHQDFIMSVEKRIRSRLSSKKVNFPGRQQALQEFLKNYEKLLAADPVLGKLKALKSDPKIVALLEDCHVKNCTSFYRLKRALALLRAELLENEDPTQKALIAAACYWLKLTNGWDDELLQQLEGLPRQATALLLCAVRRANAKGYEAPITYQRIVKDYLLMANTVNNTFRDTSDGFLLYKELDRLNEMRLIIVCDRKAVMLHNKQFVLACSTETLLQEIQHLDFPGDVVRWASEEPLAD